MEALILQKEIEPLPKQKIETLIFKNAGLLSSNYIQETFTDFFHSSPKSLFGIKQHKKNKQYQFTFGIDTILKLFVFAIILSLALT